MKIKVIFQTILILTSISAFANSPSEPDICRFDRNEFTQALTLPIEHLRSLKAETGLTVDQHEQLFQLISIRSTAGKGKKLDQAETLLLKGLIPDQCETVDFY